LESLRELIRNEASRAHPKAEARIRCPQMNRCETQRQKKIREDEYQAWSGKHSASIPRLDGLTLLSGFGGPRPDLQIPKYFSSSLLCVIFTS
jgi:hypothetical protein